MLTLVLLNILTAHAAEYHWDVDTTFASPDCVSREVITINGNYMGPEIRVAPGEEIIIHVTNKMPFQAISIHWHGNNFVKHCKTFTSFCTDVKS